MQGRQPADPAARLAVLRAARKVAKPEDVLGAQEMAAALKMTWRNLKLIIDADDAFPIIRRGGEGVPWRMSAIAVLEHLITGCESALAARGQRQARIDRLSGAPAVKATKRGKAQTTTEEPPLSIDDMRKLGDVQMNAHKLKMMQGRYVVADANAAMLSDYHRSLQSNVLGLVGKIDPAGQWPAAVRLAVEDGMRTLLVDLQGMMVRYLESQRVARAA